MDVSVRATGEALLRMGVPIVKRNVYADGISAEGKRYGGNVFENVGHSEGIPFGE